VAAKSVKSFLVCCYVVAYWSKLKEPTTKLFIEKNTSSSLSWFANLLWSGREIILNQIRAGEK